MAQKAASRRPAPLTISAIGKAAGLARSTLLYYERIGLLLPKGRSSAGYRHYGVDTLERVRKIMELRAAGLPLQMVRRVLEARTPLAEALERQLIELNHQLAAVRAQQRVVLSLLQSPAMERRAAAMSKATWTKMFRAIGMTDEGMWEWHAQFERFMPEAHKDFLESLGLEPAEVKGIRASAGASRQGSRSPQSPGG